MPACFHNCSAHSPAQPSSARLFRPNTAHTNGFTLIELMFVLLILGIVLALAYPSYLESVRKARRADAAATLMDRAQSLERCFTRFNSYSNDACPTPAGTSVDGFYTITVEPETPTTTYTLTATPVGDQLNDRCGTLTIDNLGNKTPTPDNNRCWGSRS